MPNQIKQHRPIKLKSDVKKAIAPRVIPLNTKAWQKLRSYVLTIKPLCADCLKLGLLEPATDVDHHDNNPNNNHIDNLVGLCHSCHSRKTRLWMNGKNHQNDNGIYRTPNHTHKAAL